MLDPFVRYEENLVMRILFQEPTQIKNTKYAPPSQVDSKTLFAKVRLGKKYLARSNVLAYYKKRIEKDLLHLGSKLKNFLRL